MSSTHLWPLTEEDISSIELVERETQLTFWGIENYRKFLRDCQEYYGCKAITRSDGKAKGFAGFLLARSVFDDLEILKIGVLPAFQRKGIGTTLMEAAYLEGSRRGCRRCFLEVRMSNRIAIEFYYRHGFKVAGSRLNYYSDPVEDAWIMERPL
jgi:ribosomal-protein-alanine N-acetyltransferase